MWRRLLTLVAARIVFADDVDFDRPASDLQFGSRRCTCQPVGQSRARVRVVVRASGAGRWSRSARSWSMGATTPVDQADGK